MSKVVFISKNNLEKIPEAMEMFGLEKFRERKVLVKLHMGEKGNKWFVEPGIVKKICDKLNQSKSKPFLFDTIPCYSGGRGTKEEYMETAKMNGFGGIGYPIVIGDEGTNVRMNDHSFEVAKEMFNSEFIVAISHVKGHDVCAFGGAIKNFGMGGVSAKTKKFIHNGGQPVLNESKCNQCGKCEEVCLGEELVKKKAIRIENGWNVNYKYCPGCGRCVRICQYEALSYRIDNFSKLLALAAKACLSGKEVMYINVALKITRLCDCCINSLPIICEDIGIFVSNDPVAIDNASVDLVEKSMGKTFKEIYGVDAKEQIKFAESFGLGKTSYELIEI